MNNKKLRYILIISAIFTIVLSLAFTGWLNITSFIQNYRESLIRGYTIEAQETVKKIEYGVEYGKSLNRFHGMDELLNDIGKNNKDISIVNLNGNMIYHTNEEKQGKKVNEKIWNDLEGNKLDYEKNYRSIHKNDKYHLFIPIKDKDTNHIGFLKFSFKDKLIKEEIKLYTKKLSSVLGIIALIASIFLIILISKINIIDKNNKVKKKYILTILLIILSLTQLIFSFVNYSVFEKGYEDIGQNNTKLVARIVKRDIESVIDKGVLYRHLYEISDYLDEIKEIVPEINNIYIKNKSNRILHSTKTMSFDKSNNNFVYNKPLIVDDKNNTQVISVELSNFYIRDKMKNILVDMMTSLAVSLLFMVEVTLFIFIIAERKFGFKSKLNKENFQNEDKKIIRPLSFLVFTGAFMPVSFIPIIMKNLYKPTFNLPKDIILGLPLSVESLFAFIMIMGAGYLIDKKGYKPLLILGILIFAVGTLLSSNILNVFQFLFSRSIVGLGLGLMIISMRRFVISTNSNIKKGEGIKAMNSGALAGISCGVVIGGMIAERFGYPMVFFVSIGIISLAQIFTVMIMKNKVRTLPKSSFEKNIKNTFTRFINNSEMLKFLILISIPVSIASMFLIFYLPIYIDIIGLSAANVGIAFLINGICVICLAPILSKYTQKYFGILKSLILSIIIIGISFILFSLNNNIIMVFVVALLLGVSESFGLAAQTNYFFQIEMIEQIRKEKSVGYYSLVSKLGQIIGPIVFSIAIMIGIVKGVGLIGYLILFSLLILIFLYKKDKL
ncbi:MAG: MFS transporter [Bacillota bacterium]